MEAPVENHSNKFENAAIAYLLAVTSAALAFTLLLEGPAVITGGFESATTNSPLTKALHLLIMTPILFLIGWIFAFFTAFIPFAVGIAIARLFKISHWLYFVGGGAFTAAMLCSLAIDIPDLGINVQEPEPTFEQKYLNGLPYFLVCGSVAGIVCWQYLRRGFIKYES